MKKLQLFLIATFSLSLLLFSTGCDEISDIFKGEVDPLITEESASQESYPLRTPFYDIQVAIDINITTPDNQVLNSIDSAAMSFFNCQFAEGQNLGLDNFQLSGGTMVPPMSELRVLVVPFTFECDAADKDICAGIYYNSSDILIIAEESIGRCGDFPLLEHEVAHRYGMDNFHNNIEEFEACIATENCGFSDFLDLDIGG